MDEIAQRRSQETATLAGCTRRAKRCRESLEHVGAVRIPERARIEEEKAGIDAFDETALRRHAAPLESNRCLARAVRTISSRRRASLRAAATPAAVMR